MASLFGSTNAKPAASPKTAGLDNNNTSTNQQGVVLRYFAGFRRFALTWLGPAYHQKSQAIKSASGKGGGQTTGHNYYADCAGLACLGPVDAIHEIWLDQDLVWHGTVERGNSDSATIDIPKKGRCTIYWGTETQPIDPILAPFGHPAYRGQCVLVFQKLYFGRDKTTAPNVEVTVRREAGAIPGLPPEQDFDSDVFPPFPMAELLTNPRYGLGWDAAATLDIASWGASAARLRAEELAISPLIDREQEARALLVQFAEYFDGFFTADARTGGRLALRLARAPEGDPAALPLIGEFELLDAPDLNPQSWGETVNEISVQFVDRDKAFQDDSEPFRNIANRRVTGGPLPLSVDRPWFTRRYQAARAAAFTARMRGVPWLEGQNVAVRKEAAADIHIGEFIRLTYGDYVETLLMRVTARKVPSDRSQSVELDLRADGYFADVLPYVPDTPPVADTPVIEPTPALAERIIELPFGLVKPGVDHTRPQFAALVARAGALETRAIIYASEADTGPYEEVAQTDHFCVFATLGEPLPVTPSLDDSRGLLLDFPGADGPLDLEVTTERGRQKCKLLVFLEDEIIAYRDVELVSATRARLVGLRRGGYDTLPAAHAAGAPALIIRRSLLADITSSVFEIGDPAHWKVATATAVDVLDLALADELTVNPIQNRTVRPLAMLNLRVNGDGLAPTCPAGADVLVEWDLTGWSRHRFWDAWDDPYFDPALKSKVKIRPAPGAAPVRRIRLDAGVASWTYAAADLAADFGGAAPGSFVVELVSRVRGLPSLLSSVLTVTLSA